MKSKFEIIKNMGIGWTTFRLKYELEKKFGILKRQFPTFNYNLVDINSLLISSTTLDMLKPKNFFFSHMPLDQLSKKELDMSEAVKEADLFLQGKITFFSKHRFELKKIDWHFSPLTKKKSPQDKHWSDISDLNSEFGDIKWIWELSRFSFAYLLVRAFSQTNESKYVIAFWELFEDFISQNPPELGANFKCGQEMSLRIMAWTFALNAFKDHEQTTNNRVQLMLKAIHHHADHVEKHFDFALKSVKNNHSLSEAAGMYTVGIVFPFFKNASKWREKGKKFIQSEANWQIYDDGSYIQHSMNYQRLAIQDLTWVVRLGQINNDDFSREFINKFKSTVMFLFQHQESKNGRVPNYGMNDGAYIHPLTSCHYLDYRPVLQAAWSVLEGKRIYDLPEIDEITIWFTGRNDFNLDSLNRKSMAFEKGGYYTLRQDNQFAAIRCATYKHRPLQADMLHIDFWDGEYNILADAGTYSYNTNQDDLLYFNGTSSHNTIMINNKDQMKKASRFIWLNWTKSKNISFKKSVNWTVFEGEHYGYAPITHRRGVFQSKDFLIIVDDIIGTINNESVRQSWLFGVGELEKIASDEIKIKLPNDIQWKIKSYLSKSISTNIYKGSTNPVAGWSSLYYGHKEPVPQLINEYQINEPSRIITVFSKLDRESKVFTERNLIKIDNLKINLKPINSERIFDVTELE